MAPGMGSYDLVVIGAGVNGAGVACGAALRGFRVCPPDISEVHHEF